MAFQNFSKPKTSGKPSNVPIPQHRCQRPRQVTRGVQRDGKQVPEPKQGCLFSFSSLGLTFCQGGNEHEELLSIFRSATLQRRVMVHVCKCGRMNEKLPSSGPLDADCLECNLWTIHKLQVWMKLQEHCLCSWSGPPTCSAKGFGPWGGH